MCGKAPRRKARIVEASLAVAIVAFAVPARAEGLWDTLLERMNVKASPAGPGPDFVERTRPDPAGLGYLPTATPHKVSPLAVKGDAEIQAQKDALDLAKARQLDPQAGKPLQVVKPTSAASAGAASGTKPAARGTAAKLQPAAKPAAVSD